MTYVLYWIVFGIIVYLVDLFYFKFFVHSKYKGHGADKFEWASVLIAGAIGPFAILVNVYRIRELKLIMRG